MFGLGVHELMIVGLVAVLLFGKKLPEVARSLGSSYREFRKGLNEFQSQMHVDTYKPATSYSSTRTTYNNDYEEPTAPKFEPPPAEPTAESAVESPATSSDSSYSSDNSASDEARTA